MDKLKRQVDLFAALGIEAAVLHHGGYKLAQQGWPGERVLARKQEAIGRVCEFAKGTVTRICIENLPPPHSPAFEDIRPLVDFLPDEEIGICLDTAHANRGGVDCAEFVRSAGARIKALHISDSISEYDHILPNGPGTINWGDFISALQEMNYDGLFNFEIAKENRCPMEVRLLKLDYTKKMAEWMIDKQAGQC